MSDKHRVFLKSCDRYSKENVSQFLDGLSDFFPFSGLDGKKILLKPNLIGVRKKNINSCTHPLMITTVAGWLAQQGAKVAVGDSPAFGSTASILKKLGIEKKWLKKRGIDIREFRTAHPVVLPSGIKVVLAAELFEYDLLINLPKIKAHDQLFVTMAVKNLFGMVKGLQKAKLHMSQGSCVDHFAALLLDLVTVLPTNVSIADGVEVMHRHGPLSGDSLKLGVLGAAVNPVAFDTAMLTLLELDQKKSPIHRQACERMMNGASMDEISFPLAHPADFYGSGFIGPKRLNPIRFNPLRFLYSSAKRLFLQRRS